MNENDILTATGDELTGYGVAAILIFFIFIALGLGGAYYTQVKSRIINDNIIYMWCMIFLYAHTISDFFEQTFFRRSEIRPFGLKPGVYHFRTLTTDHFRLITRET